MDANPALKAEGKMLKPGIHELNYEDRATWGECPVCHAEHGEKCNPDVGMHLGRTITGKPATDGAHLARLNLAPRTIKIEEIF